MAVGKKGSDLVGEAAGQWVMGLTGRSKAAGRARKWLLKGRVCLPNGGLALGVAGRSAAGS